VGFREKVMTTKSQKQQIGFTRRDFLKDLKKVSQRIDKPKASPKPLKT